MLLLPAQLLTPISAAAERVAAVRLAGYWGGRRNREEREEELKPAMQLRRAPFYPASGELEEAKRLEQLGEGNKRLKETMAEQQLDIKMLKHRSNLAEGNW